MNVYQKLGVKTFINAMGPVTRFGGNLMSYKVAEAMSEASRFSVNIYELQDRLGVEIARLTRNEACYISCGACSGVTLAIAACMAGMDKARASSLPNTTGFPNKVIIQKREQGTEADSGIRNAGATLVPVGRPDSATAEDIISGIDAETAAIFSLGSECDQTVPLKKLIEIGKKYGVRVICDIANGVPPIEHFWRYTREIGFDAAIVSGGKGIRGPQSTGLILGKSEIIASCIELGSPNDGIGRGMKVGKEEMIGLYTAVDLLIGKHADVEPPVSHEQLERFLNEIRSTGCVEDSRIASNVAWFKLGLDRINCNVESFEALLFEGDDAMKARCFNDGWIGIDGNMLRPSELEIVLQKVLRTVKQCAR